MGKLWKRKKKNKLFGDNKKKKKWKKDKKNKFDSKGKGSKKRLGKKGRKGESGEEDEEFEEEDAEAEDEGEAEGEGDGDDDSSSSSSSSKPIPEPEIPDDVHLFAPAFFGTNPYSCLCPECEEVITTNTERLMGVFAWMCFFCCCPLLCWLPAICPCCKDVQHSCPQCEVVLGRYRRCRCCN